MDIDPASILFVDDEVCVLDALKRSLMGQRSVWDLRFAHSVDEALGMIHEDQPDVVVTDITMPGRDGLELLQTLHGDPVTERLPVIILTGLADHDLKQRALDMGAFDLLNKPIVTQDLVARIRSTLRVKSYQDRLAEANQTLEKRVGERTFELEQSRLEIIWRLAKAGEYRDEQSGNHVIRVGLYCRALAMKLGMSQEFTDSLFLTAPLHDIGKIGIPDNVLLKGGPLNAEEWRVMKTHCQVGYDILQEDPVDLEEFLCWRDEEFTVHQSSIENPFLKQAASIALTHHEQWGGKGYPNGLKGNQIPMESRIVTIADIYDALSQIRPYKPAYSEHQVISIMTEEAPWRFDPEIFEVFMDIRNDFAVIKNEYSDRATWAA